MRRTTARRRRGQQGAAAVEFALLVPLICILVFATMSYAYMFSFRQTLSQAAAEGARAAVGGSKGAGCSPTATSFPVATCPAQSAASSAVANVMGQYDMACGTGHLSCTLSQPAACTSGGGTCMTVTVSYPYRQYDLLPTVPGMGFTLPRELRFSTTVVIG